MAYKLYLLPAYGKSVNTVMDLTKLWESGVDFRMYDSGTYFAYCSIRDFDMLKKDYDHIILRSCNKNKTVIIETPIFTHILAGVTTYI